MKYVALLSASLLLFGAAPSFSQSSSQPVTADSGEVEPGRYLVFFGFDQATLTPEARRTVEAAARNYEETGSASIEITGHTDLVGSDGYNRDLSDRRAMAVEDELVRQGVPRSAVGRVIAAGETQPLVSTPEGVREPRNRRVEIVVPQAEPEPVVAQPAEPEPEPVVEPAPAVEPEPQRQRLFGGVEIGGVYGHNFEEGNGAESDLFGVKVGVFGLPTPFIPLSLEQIVYQTDNSKDDGIGGRTVLGADVQLPATFGVQPFVGLNAGGIYGKGAQDGIIVGPEAGLKIGLARNVYLYGKAAYDWQVWRNPAIDEGILLGDVGVGFRF